MIYDISNCTLLQPSDAGRLDVAFEQPQRADTTGKSVVFYANDECLGGGAIIE